MEAFIRQKLLGSDRGNGWNVMAFVIEEVTQDDLMVPPGHKPDDSPLMLPR